MVRLAGSLVGEGGERERTAGILVWFLTGYWATGFSVCCMLRFFFIIIFVQVVHCTGKNLPPRTVYFKIILGSVYFIIFEEFLSFLLLIKRTRNHNNYRRLLLLILILLLTTTAINCQLTMLDHPEEATATTTTITPMVVEMPTTMAAVMLLLPVPIH